MKNNIVAGVEVVYNFTSSRINARDPLNWLLSPVWSIVAIGSGALADWLDPIAKG